MSIEMSHTSDFVSVCVLVTAVSPAKMAEEIKMPLIRGNKLALTNHEWVDGWHTWARLVNTIKRSELGSSAGCRYHCCINFFSESGPL